MRKSRIKINDFRGGVHRLEVGAGGGNKRPQFPSIGEGEIVIEILEGGEEGGGTNGHLRAKSDEKIRELHGW